VYDASRGAAEPFSYYVWWSSYILALLTPAAIWLAWRFPVNSKNWHARVPLHLAASVALACLELSLESYLGWLRHHRLSVGGALRHYFSQHAQISVLAYWFVVTATLVYRTREDALANSARSARLEAQLSAARLEMLRRQIHPHFLFNTLQAATTLVKDDADRAEEILLRLSELLRVSLHESEQQQIRLERELKILDHYIAIQTCRFADRLHFDVCVDRDVLACAVPALILQPIVENAVRHGIGINKSPDTISIRAFRRDDCLHLTVCNLTSKLTTPAEQSSRGVGLATTRERLEQLYGRSGASFRLTNQQPKGVCAEITIPFRVVAPQSRAELAGVPS
jgi:two-component system, LytTR family, sensor kinase